MVDILLVVWVLCSKIRFMNYDFTGKKVAILGFGVEGMDACDYFLKRKSEIDVFDIKKTDEFEQCIIESYSKVKFHCGPDYLNNDFSKFDYLIRSPGINPQLLKKLKPKIELSRILTPTQLFLSLFSGKTIGVTGTKGKGTTTTLIFNILKESGKKVCIGGNIGIPLLSILDNEINYEWAVMEMSSFQLIDMQISPNIAVVLNITCDHLDWHKDIKEYQEAKTNIVCHQSQNDCAIINADYRTSKIFEKYTKAKKYYFSRQKKVNGSYVHKNMIFTNIDNKLNKIGKTVDLQLKGEHNWENITAAVCTSAVLNIDPENIAKSIYSFKGLEHRLEFVREFKKVKFYNDSFSTNPQTMVAAINSFKENITIIIGGYDKGLDYSLVGKEISRKTNVKNVVLIGDISKKIFESLSAHNYQGKIIEMDHKSMKDIVKTAFNNTNVGGVVLLSPATSSFDMFDNYKVRGNEYKKYVLALK